MTHMYVRSTMPSMQSYKTYVASTQNYKAYGCT